MELLSHGWHFVSFVTDSFCFVSETKLGERVKWIFSWYLLFYGKPIMLSNFYEFYANLSPLFDDTKKAKICTHANREKVVEVRTRRNVCWLRGLHRAMPFYDWNIVGFRARQKFCTRILTRFAISASYKLPNESIERAFPFDWRFLFALAGFIAFRLMTFLSIRKWNFCYTFPSSTDPIYFATLSMKSCSSRSSTALPHTRLIE